MILMVLRLSGWSWLNEGGFSYFCDGKRVVKSEDFVGRKRVHIRCLTQLPRWYDLEKMVRNWVEEWQNLLAASLSSNRPI